MFVIRKLVVNQNCDKEILKVLKPGEYAFADKRYDEFFQNGVTLCSVVGKNGSGKSSLVELLFRMVNNLGAMMLRNVDRPSETPVYFVSGIEAELFFEIDKKEGILRCKNESVELSHNGHNFKWELPDGNCLYEEDQAYRPQNKNDFAIALEIANHFFYLIATNYSMQAYISEDYKSEPVYAWQNKEKGWGSEFRKVDDGCWMNSMFHKNDGYMFPIVLNPERKAGIIDMKKETRLTISRLCALLLQYQNEDFEIIEGYRLAYITYTFNQKFLSEKFNREMLSEIPVEKISNKFLYVYIQGNSYAEAILDGYGIDATEAMTPVELVLRLYLVYKTLRIANKYPQYYHFKQISLVDNAFRKSYVQSELDLAKELAQRINSLHTHIELKVHQTIDLIKHLNESQYKEAFGWFMTYDDYNEFLGIEPHCETLLDRLNSLPPPLYIPEIYLIKTEDYNQIDHNGADQDKRKKAILDKSIRLSRLSSGERQFIFMTSTLLYHAFNILSIPKGDRLAYRNLCMVLDEVEICFHPEYQRTFISDLLSLFHRTRLDQELGINVIVMTHSPFVLSDIPKENILYLDNGENVTGEKRLNTFGANINELLHQSFFLSGGFMGEFAKEKIESLVNYLKDDKNDADWNEETAKKIIDMVGDEVIHYQLQQLYARKFRDSDRYREWIKNEASRLGL